MRPLFFAALLLVACSSSTESPATTAGDASSETTSSGCVNPVEGAACTVGATLCPGNEGGCCAGYVWGCQDGKWIKQGLGCACLPEDTGTDDTAKEAGDAGPFACGSSTCSPDQMCRAQAPGVPDAGTSYSCIALPAGCESTPTCECVKAKIGASCVVDACSLDAQGHVTVSCMGA